MTRSSSDTLSLTLPSRSKSRARRRKLKPPPVMFWFWLALTIWGVYESTHLLIEGNIPWALLNMVTAAIDWKVAQRVYRRQSYMDMLPLLIGVGVVSIPMLFIFPS